MEDKGELCKIIRENLFTFFPDFLDSVIFSDTFTPKTIFKYTGHTNGLVYGSPVKL